MHLGDPIRNEQVGESGIHQLLQFDPVGPVDPFDPSKQRIGPRLTRAIRADRGTGSGLALLIGPGPDGPEWAGIEKPGGAA